MYTTQSFKRSCTAEAKQKEKSAYTFSASDLLRWSKEIGTRRTQTFYQTWAFATIKILRVTPALAALCSWIPLLIAKLERERLGLFFAQCRIGGQTRHIDVAHAKPCLICPEIDWDRLWERLSGGIPAAFKVNCREQPVDSVA